MPPDESVRRTPEIVATVVNALMVLFLPIIVSAVASLVPDNTHSGAVGYAPGSSPLIAATRGMILNVSLMAPFSAVAAWRTWVHATRWREGERSFQGVLEAGSCGFAAPAIPLILGVGPRLQTNPLLALGNVLFYATFGFVIGLVVGIFLQLTAMIVLMVLELVTESPRPAAC